MNETEILENQETAPAASPTVDGSTEESRSDDIVSSFQYIPCYGLSTRGAGRTYRFRISIHPMLRFIRTAGWEWI